MYVFALYIAQCFELEYAYLRLLSFLLLLLFRSPHLVLGHFWGRHDEGAGCDDEATCCFEKAAGFETWVRS